MYRVLIVDDEPVIRHGISAYIDWEKEQMSVDYDCENGEEALNALENGSFDILITDIKMPVMDGIELMRQALELHPSLKVVLVSSYSDFEYVREGLKLGAVDYLLKSALEPEDILAVIRRCISILQEERSNLRTIMYQKRKMLEQEIKRLILQEQLSASTAISDTTWLKSFYLCAYVMLDGAKEWQDNHGYSYVHFMMEELQELFYAKMEEGTAMLADENSLFLLLPDQDGEAEYKLRNWKLSAQSKWGISTSAGFVRELGTGSITKGFSGSRLACQRRFFDGLGGLHKLEEKKDPEGKTIADKKADYDWTPYFNILRNGDPVSSAVDMALERWKSGVLNPEQVKQEACSLHLQEESLLLKPDQLDILRGAETLEQLASHLTVQLLEIRKPFIPNMTERISGREIIEKALEYIAANYTENLTLQSAADYVHLSKNYFSLLFKRQTGLNFIDYLIELRIREAKRLLGQNDARIGEVAKAAGFNDVKYFSRIFKKVVGITPMEYREKHQGTGSQIV